MSRIFISYRRADSEGYVGRLYDHLTQHFSRENIFMDVDTIRPGEDFVTVLENAIEACEVVIAVIGQNWLTVTNEAGERRLDQWNDFVRIELATALKLNKRVIPILVQRASMPRPDDLPEDLAKLARRNAMELSHERFGYDMGKLVEVLKEIIPDAVTVSAVLPTPVVSNVDPAVIAEKNAKIKAIHDAILKAEDSPLYEFRTKNNLHPVIGEGNPDAKIMFIGQAPGKNESETGRPFTGPSGEVLTEMLGSIGLRREDVFLTNILFDRPPTKRDPLPHEIEFYTSFLDQLIEIVQPLVIGTLGGYATTFVLRKYNITDHDNGMGKLHGKLIPAQASYGEIHLIPLYHPAFVLYLPNKKSDLRQDFQKLRVYV